MSGTEKRIARRLLVAWARELRAKSEVAAPLVVFVQRVRVLLRARPA